MAEPKRKPPARRAAVKAAPQGAPKSAGLSASNAAAKSDPALLERTPPLEWIAAGVGLLVTLSAIGFLIWHSLQPHSDVAVVQAAVRAISPSPAGFQVQVEAANDTRVTAAGVEVEGVLALPGGDEEVSTITFDYVPGGGRRDGVLVFRNDPRVGGLTVSARGHVGP